jgi:hypothetical protein
MRSPRITLSRTLAVGVVAMACWVLFIAVDAADGGHLYTGDSNLLVAGTRAAFDCIDTGQWTKCGYEPSNHYTAVGPYPPLQYLPSSVLMGVFDVDELRALELLARFNWVVFALSLVLAAVPFRKNSSLWPFVVLAIAFSSASYQSTSAFGEMLAAGAVLALAVAALYRRPGLILIASFFASLGKETLPPFLLALVAIAAFDRSSGWRALRKPMVAAAIGSACAIAVMAALNLFRFGTLWNANYLSDTFRTPGMLLKLEVLAGIWLSPSAGVAAFWPLATVLSGAGLLVAIFRARRAPDDKAGWIIPAAIVLLAVAFTAGLTSWYAPFGWIAYGPRLAVPMLPALVVVTCKKCEVELTNVVRAVGNRRLVALVAAVVIALLGIPQATAPWSYQASMQNLMAGDSTCPQMLSVSLADRDQYFDCLSHFMWRTRPSSVWAAARRGTEGAGVAQVLAGTAAIALAYGGFRAERDEDERGEMETPAGDRGHGVMTGGFG